MNTADRKRVSELASALEDIAEELETMHQAEDEKYNNLVDSLQGGPTGVALGEASDELDEASGDVREVVDKLRALAEAP